MVKKAYKYRFYPNDDQAELLAKTFGCVRFIYNSTLRWRTDAYYEAKEKIGYIQANAFLTDIKKNPEYVWLNDVSSVPLQQCLRNQQAAFTNFFAGRAKYPTFKKKNNKQSFELTYRAFSFKDNQLFIAKNKTPLDIKWSQSIPSDPSTVTISKDAAGRYFVSMLCEFEPKLLPVNKQSIGIDLGIKNLFITDKGEKYNNPRHTLKYSQHLAKMQKRLSKKKLGSANRQKAKIKVARVHAKIADCRKDNLHKLSRKLINENQVVCAETLRVKNMIRNPKLSKHIADASWGEFTRQLEYKASWYGRTFTKIDVFFPSSKRCSCCGFVVDALPLDIRLWTCEKCNTDHDRDINAAKNILTAGLAGLAFGENVSDSSISC